MPARSHLALSALLALLLSRGGAGLLLAAPDSGGGVLFPLKEEEALQTQLRHHHLKAGKYVQPHAVAPSARVDRERYALLHGSPFPANLRYLLFTPESAGSRRMPLVVYFPGSGEVGEDVKKQFRQKAIFDIVASAEFQTRHPCYFLAISLPTGTRTMYDGLPGKPSAIQELVMGAVRTVAESCSAPYVDMNRLYVIGFSFGGECAYGLALAYPGVFAAAMPVATFPPPPSFVSASHPGAWWHIYNAGDYSAHGIKPEMLRPFAQRVKACGGEFRTGTYPREGHNAWSAAWREKTAWDWLFSKSLDGRVIDDGQPAAVLAGPQPVGSRPAGKSEADKLKRVVTKDISSAVCTASVPGKGPASAPRLAVDGLDGTAYVSARPVKKDDWFKVEFPSTASGTIIVKTGASDGHGKDILRKGAVEVSFDGHTWKRRGKFSEKTGECELRLKTDVIKFIRIVPDPEKPQPLVIREISLIPQ